MERLITTDDVRKVCLGKAKFDVARFEPFLEPAELDYMKPFLGTEFYAEIKTQYLADTISTDNQTLINLYLKKSCAWITLAKALPFLNIDISNSGLQRNNSDFASASSKEERADLVSSAIANADAYLDEAKIYIETQQTDNNKYPLYSIAENVDSSTKIIGGIILDTED